METLKTVPSIKATIIGQVALVIWALSASGAVFLKSLPSFQVCSEYFWVVLLLLLL